MTASRGTSTVSPTDRERRGSKIARVALARRLLTLAFYALRDEGCRAYPPCLAHPVRPGALAVWHGLA